MITNTGDGIVLIFEDSDIKIRRVLSIDKPTGLIRIKDYDINTKELVNDIKCTVFDLDTLDNLTHVCETDITA